jgi:DNA-binding NtrC family response regulator
MEENSQEISQPAVSVKKQIVVYGKHDYIVKNVIDLLSRADYNATGYTNLEEVLDHIRLSSFDAVLIGGGVDPHDRQQIKNLVSTDYKHAKVIEHYGGPATIISEMKSALVG